MNQGGKKQKKKKNVEPSPTPTPSTLQSVASSTFSSPPQTETPVSSVWVPGGGLLAKEVNYDIVIGFTSKVLWHSTKFIRDKSDQLKYDVTDPTSICYNLLKGCNLTFHIDRSKWWNTKASKWVRNSITNLRSNKMTALKHTFYGRVLCIFAYDLPK